MKAKKYTRETIRDMGTEDRGWPAFSIGDTIAVSQRIKEGDKERLQVLKVTSLLCITKVSQAHSPSVESVRMP